MKRDEKRWEEMRRDEKRWEEMRRDDKRWGKKSLNNKTKRSNNDVSRRDEHNQIGLIKNGLNID